MKNIDDDLDDSTAEFEDKSFVVSSTSWGDSGIEDDYRALRKYKELLESLSNAGTVCAYLLIFALCTLSVWIVYSTDFDKENVTVTSPLPRTAFSSSRNIC